MKILIVGEFSGFARHLKIGFQRLGHDVIVVQSGDGWKMLANEGDIICRNKSWHIGGVHILGSNRIMAVYTNIKVRLQLRKKCSTPDMIIVINYTFLRKNITEVGVSCRYISSLLKKGTKLIMSECGNSCAQAYLHPDYYRMIGKKTPTKDRRYSFLLTNSKVIIPTTYYYYEQLKAYASHYSYDTSKLSNAIPLPISLQNDVKLTSCKNRKIVIFHGVIRPIDKGTPFIKEAMNRLQKEMPDRVECVCEGGIPYDEYVKLFDRVDILVDQTYGNGWGMNALIGAMKGKCVLAPCGLENSANMGIPDIPFVQIGPDSELIYQTLRDLVLNPDKIDSIKVSSRNFVEKYCNSDIIARRYIDLVVK